LTRSKKLLQIHIHHEAAPLLDIALRLDDCVMRTRSRTKTVAVLRETRIESRLQDLQQGLLDESVASSCSRSAGQWARRYSGSSSTVIPSMPALPFFQSSSTSSAWSHHAAYAPGSARRKAHAN
jgi:hypothetical protein